MWSENEKSKSSTWKEMKAIEQALITFKEVNNWRQGNEFTCHLGQLCRCEVRKK
jgi:hypothetical protein